IPIVLVAIIALFALKAFGLIFEGGYTLAELTPQNASDPEATGAVAAPKGSEGKRSEGKRAEGKRTEAPKTLPPEAQPSQQSQQQSQQSGAQQMSNFPDITGAVAESKSAPEPAPKGNRPLPKGAEAPQPASAAPVPPERPVSPAERAILERLSER